jgi:AcrR family transcriptional regulator
VIDTAATTIDNALGCAHIYKVPLHEVLRKQDKGIYRSGFVGLFDRAGDKTEQPVVEPINKNVQEVEIVEYHGLVPKRLFDAATRDGHDDSVDFLAQLNQDAAGTEDDSTELVEAIVWIANRGTLLKITRNPFIMQDRSFISFQYDTVPNRFWGRGVAEKGYNPQKGLDAELRARIDSLALSTYPMLLINGMMAPRNQDYQVRPGRNIVVSGNVGEAIAPFKFPAPDPQSYKQTAEFERMVTVATGSLDSAAPLGVNPRNETASGISMMLSAVLKRSKRTLRNIEHQFLSPLVHKIAWRYMQFDNTRYPTKDYKFKVVGALGAQAREFEVAQLTQLLQTQPPDQPGYWIILKGILRNYNVEDKEALIAIIDQFLQKSLNPEPPQPTPEQQVKMEEQARKERELNFKIEQAVENELRKDLEVEAEAERDRGEAIWNASEAVLNARKAETEKVKALSALITSLASAAGVEGAQLSSLVGEAEGLIEEAVVDAQDEPELASLRASMKRQMDDVETPGIREDSGNGNRTI